MTKLADRYAAAKAQADALALEIDAMKKEIKALGSPFVEGDFCLVTVSMSTRTNFDAKLARQFLTEEQISACESIGTVETIRVKAKVPGTAK